MKKLTTLAAAALALAMTGAGALAETTLQLGTTVNEQDSFHVAAVKFAELVDPPSASSIARSSSGVHLVRFVLMLIVLLL